MVNAMRLQQQFPGVVFDMLCVGSIYMYTVQKVQGIEQHY